MKLLECHIEGFGKLSDFKHSFSDGLNTLKAENGWGKTTLTVFIKAMLYGLDDTKKQRLTENDRKHYLPWNGKRCGGSLTVSAGGKVYIIERTFAQKASDDTFKLYDAKTMKESSDFGENIGEELLGIDADGFLRTVFLSEANVSGKNENKSVSARLSGLVGYDGDLGVMDEAMELIEKQRKFYYKRGGGGEIGELDDKISSLTREINDLSREAEEYSRTEAELCVINAELEKNAVERSKAATQAKLQNEARLAATYRKQYNEMRAAIEKDEATAAAHSEFFKNGVPSANEIERARELLSESKRILDKKADEADDGYSKLSELFCREDSDSKIGSLRSLKERLEGARQRKNLINDEISRNLGTASAPMPSIVETEGHISAVANANPSKKANKSCLFLLPIGVVLAFLGVILGLVVAPILYSVSALGALMLVISIAVMAIDGSQKDEMNRMTAAKLFVLRYTGTNVSDGELQGALQTIYQRVLATEDAQKRNRELFEKLTAEDRELKEANAEAVSILESFGIFDTGATDSAISDIVRRYEVYLALKRTRMSRDEEKEREIRTAVKHREDAEAFLSRFPTVTDSPFDEINSKLLEYTAINRSLARMKESLEDFRISHNIDPNTAISENETEYSITTDPAALEAARVELTRKKTLTERRLAEIASFISKKEDLIIIRDELSEKRSAYEKKLSVLVKTKDFLAEAKDSLTSKYLSKTKAAFDKYITLIGRASPEDFKMDTSFAIMKNEQGSLKDTEAYSRGTRDLIALATRLALVDSLYDAEQPFIILDDPFAYFDDVTLRCALSALGAISEEKQVIYLTCTDSRR